MRSLFITFVTISLVYFISYPAEAQTTSSWAIRTLEEMSIDDGDDFDSLILLCDSVVSIFEDLQLPCYQIKALIKKANYCTISLKYEDASQMVVQAKVLYDNNQCNPQILPEIYFRQAYIYLKLNDFDRCDSLCQEIIHMYQPDWTNKEVLINAYLNLNFNETDISILMPNMDSAYALAIKYDVDEYLLQKILINKGTIYAMNGMMEPAREQLLQALKIAKERNNAGDIGLLYNNLAGLEEDIDKVLIYIDSAVYYAELANNIPNLQYFVQNRALAHKWQGNYKKAYDDLWWSFELKDTLYNREKYRAIAEVEEKYESEKKEGEIKSLKLEKLNSEVEKLKYKRNQYVLFAGAFILALVAGFFAYSFVAIRKNRNILAAKNIQISEAVKRSDELLLNILPPEIAKELKQTGKADARYYKQVSILFTDLIDFTAAAEFMETNELVEELNYCFKGFDSIMEKYGIEKIKTIGDAYMSAGGIPVPSEGSVKQTILAALEMQEFISERKQQLDSSGKKAFEMRAGVHTGPVVAGIVGVKKFQYDLWGDTVNTASRMETSCEAGKVNISEVTYKLVKEDPDFVFESRGKILAKGKGKVEMYYVSRAS